MDVHPGWADALRRAKLDSFEDIFSVGGEAVEPPNEGRGGWSEVVRLKIAGPDGGPVEVFLKRQRGYSIRSFARPAGELTVARELRNLHRLAAAGLIVPLPIAFGTRRESRGVRSGLLLTLSLGSDWKSVLDVVDEWRVTMPTPRRRRLAARATARAVRRIHDLGLRHAALYPKHVFLRWSAGPDAEPQVAFLDLEKLRPTPFRARAVVRDLSTFNRRTPILGAGDRLGFFLAYCGVDRLGPRDRRLLERVARRSLARGMVRTIVREA